MRRLAVLFAIGLLLVGAAACEPAKIDNAQGISEKLFGAPVAPSGVPAWTKAVGAKPTSLLMFEQFANNRSLATQFAAVKAQGIGSVMVTWEPWQTVPASACQAAQYAVQPKYSNAAIAAGHLDAYLTTFAKGVKASGLKVYIRYAHEMNGNWYPWSHDAAGYVQAWRHVVTLFRKLGVTNAKFVWAPNGSLYQTDATFLKGVAPYWPGSSYVDYIGATMINFGGTKNYSVARFTARFKLLFLHYPLHMYICEANTDYATRVQWLTDLKTWLVSKDSGYVIGINLSQYTSRAQQQMGGAIGNLNWSVTTDPTTAKIVGSIIRSVSP